MPTYEEALAANPAAFVDYAAEMTAAGTDLTEHRAEYDSTVVAINAGWKDEANTAFNQDAVVVDGHVEKVVSQVGDTAEMLNAGGTAMESMVEQLRGLDESYRGAGFNVRPEPKVELGAVHWAAIAAAGPFGPMLQALFQARADQGTAQLQLGLSMITATDAVTGAGLTGAAEQLKPLEDKGDTTDANANAVTRTAERDDKDADDTTGKDTTGKDTTGKDGTDKKRDDGEDEKKEKDDKQKDGQDQAEEPKPEDERQQEEPGQEPPQDPQQDPEQPGAEAPGEFEQPQIPGSEPLDPGDFTAPEIPGSESEWDPAELGEPDLPSGGLAGGGGLGGGGGGIGSPESVPTGGGSGGAPVGLVGTPAGTAGTATTGGTGPRSGLGGMVGGPGARGPVNPDDEYERESFLTEDPEDDVWGIGTTENNPYVDFDQEQAQEAEAAPPPVFEEPAPFLLPGFDLPEPGQSTGRN